MFVTDNQISEQIGQDLLDQRPSRRLSHRRRPTAEIGLLFHDQSNDHFSHSRVSQRWIEVPRHDCVHSPEIQQHQTEGQISADQQSSGGVQSLQLPLRL